MRRYDREKDMTGKTLASVALSPEKDRITFAFQDGTSRSFGVEGDCCSSSWIEHLETPGDIVGAKVLSFDDSGPVTQDHPEHDEANGGDSISVYNTVVSTDRGDIVMEYRNSSNGYYGGYLVDA